MGNRMAKRKVLLCDRCKRLNESSKVIKNTEEMIKEYRRRGYWDSVSWAETKLVAAMEENAQIFSEDCGCTVVYLD